MRYKLDPEIEERFEMVGILCQQKDFKLAFVFNDLLKFSFVRIKSFSQFIDAEKPNIEFSLYYYFDEMNRIGYYLISNRSQDNILVDRLKHFDYFLIVKTENVQFKLADILKKLKKAPEVLGIFNINMTTFPNIKYFFQDIDIHVTNLNKEDKIQEDEVRKNIQKNKITWGTRR